jgi:hypothetical protein
VEPLLVTAAFAVVVLEEPLLLHAAIAAADSATTPTQESAFIEVSFASTIPDFALELHQGMKSASVRQITAGLAPPTTRMSLSKVTCVPLGPFLRTCAMRRRQWISLPACTGLTKRTLSSP